MNRAPILETALLYSTASDLARARTRVRRGVAVSMAAHGAILAGLVVFALTEIESVPPPPLTVRFYALPPPPPRLVPLSEQEPAPKPPPPPPRPRPEPAVIPPLQLAPPEPPQPTEPPRRRPEPLPARLEPETVPIRVADAAPEVKVRDSAPPAAAGVPGIGPLGAQARPRMGSGEEPELAFLTPGDRQRGAGGTGRDQVPLPGAGSTAGSIRRGGSGLATGSDAAVGSEGAFTGTGLASFLGRKYGVKLMEASRLGSRTSDGARYALVVPALSEAYRAVAFRGRRPGPDGDPVESFEVDRESIAIRYRDGTVHVLAPTSDGLVALYVSAADATTLSKVDEADRALAALQRLGRGGA